MPQSPDLPTVMWGEENPGGLPAAGGMGAAGCRGPEPSLLPPLPVAHLLISPSAEVVEGQGVTLNCRSGLSPSPDIRFSWYRNGALLLEGSSSSLHLSAASSTDAGSYYCQANDGHRDSGPSSPAILTVLCKQSSHQPLPTWGGSAHRSLPATSTSFRPARPGV